MKLRSLLLVGTSVIVGSAVLSQAQAQTVTISTTGTTTVSSDPAANPAITYTADGVAQVSSGVSLASANDNVTTSVDDQGTLTLLGGAQTVNGTIGASGAYLKAVNGGATGGVTTFNGAVDAYTIGFLGTGTIDLNANAGANSTIDFLGNNGTLNIANGVNVGSIDNTSSGGSFTTGTVNFLGNSTVSGGISADQNVQTVNAGVAGSTVTFDGIIYGSTVINIASTGTVNFGSGLGGGGLVFQGDGIANVASGGNDTATVTATTSDIGTLNFLGGTQTVSSTIGTGSDYLKAVNAGATGATTTFQAAVDASSIKFLGAGTIDLFANAGVDSTIDFAGNNGVLNIANGVTVGNLYNTGSSAGTVNFLGNSNVSGFVSDTGPIKLINAGVTGSSVVFNGVYDGTPIDIISTGNVTFAGTASNNSASVVFLADGNVFVNNGVGFGSGSFTTTTNDTGTLYLNGTSTLYAAIGSNTLYLKALLGQGSGSAVFEDPVYAMTINPASGQSFDFKAAVGGAINGDGNIGSGLGDVTIEASSPAVTTISGGGAGQILQALTLSNPIAGTPITVNTSGAVNAADTTTLGINTLNVGGVFTLGSGQTLISTIYTNNTTYGHVAAIGALNVSTTSAVDLTILSPSTLSGMTNFILASGSGGTVATLGNGELTINGVTDTGAKTLTLDGITYSQTLDGDDLEITATAPTTTPPTPPTPPSPPPANVALVGNTLNGSAVGGAITAFENTGGTNALITALNNLSPSQVPSALESLAGDINSDVQTAAQTVTHEFGSVLAKRLGGDCNTDDALTGPSAGSAWSTWACGFGSFNDIATNGGVDGYSSRLAGTMVGVEYAPSQHGLIRAGVGYSHDSLAVGAETATMNAADLGVYGQYNFFNNSDLNAYVGGTLAGGIDSDNTRRPISLTNGIATASPVGYSFSSSILLGFSASVDGITIEPVVAEEYAFHKQDSYNENGAGVADLSVDGNNTGSLRSSVGAQVSDTLRVGPTWALTPQVHASFIYDALDVAPGLDESISGVGFRIVSANPGRSGAQAGGGATLDYDENLAVFIDYNGTFKEHETDNFVMAGVKCKW